MAPQLNALIITHKEDKPNRPEINNTQAPSHKLAKYLNKRLNQLIKLPYTYATKKSKVAAQDLNNIQINNQHKITTLDIKDIYVNLPTQNIMNIIKFWLNKNSNQNIIVKQTLELIRVTLNQNYFPYNGKYFKSTPGMAMGSPTSGTLAEIYLQFFEELIVKHWMENGEIIYYRRYVDEIIVFDQNKINKDLITNHMNNMHNYLEFKLTEVNYTNYLVLYIHRNINNLNLGIYRKTI